MPRKKIDVQRQALNNWDEADNALAELAQITEHIRREEAQYNEQEQKRREALVEKQKDKKQRILELELGLEEFCGVNREDFGKAKSKKLKHGVVSFRVSTPKVSALKGWTLKACVNVIKAAENFAGLFIRTKEELNREAIIQAKASDTITQAQLADFGLEVTQEETFGYELDLAL